MLERVAKQLLAIRRPGRPPTTSLPSLRERSGGRRSYPADHRRRCAELVRRVEADLAPHTTPRVRGVALVILSCFYDGKRRAVSQAHMVERVWDRADEATSRGTVRRALAALCARGWLDRTYYGRGSLQCNEYAPTDRMLDCLEGEQLTLAPAVYAAAERVAAGVRSRTPLATYRRNTLQLYPVRSVANERGADRPAESAPGGDADAEPPDETPPEKPYSADLRVLRRWREQKDREDGGEAPT